MEDGFKLKDANGCESIRGEASQDTRIGAYERA